MKCTMKKLLIVAVASAACMSVDAASGQTTTYTWKDGNPNGNWHSRSNWDCDGACPDYPGQSANAEVVIPSATPSPVLSIDLTDVNHHPLLSMTIQTGAKLEVANNGQVEVADGMTIAGVVEVQSGGALRLLEGSDTLASGTSGKLIADGTVVFEADTGFALLLIPPSTTLSMEGHGFQIGGVVAIEGELRILADTTFKPHDTGSGLVYGEIRGEAGYDDSNPYAQLLIESGEELTIEIPLTGAMLVNGIGGTATFVNLAIVRADLEGQTLAFGSNIELEDQSESQWEAVAHDAILLLLRDATSLEGTFQLTNCGEGHVDDAEVKTCGAVTGDGVIRVFNGGQFTYRNGPSCSLHSNTITNCQEFGSGCSCSP